MCIRPAPALLLLREITKLPGFHMTRHSTRGRAITFVNGGPDYDKKGFIHDKHPRFGAALDEAHALVEEYFTQLAATPTPTLHQRRQALAQARRDQQAEQAEKAELALRKKNSFLRRFGNALLEEFKL